MVLLEQTRGLRTLRTWKRSRVVDIGVQRPFVLWDGTQLALLLDGVQVYGDGGFA